MSEKSFLEILSEKLEQQIRNDISQSQNQSIKQTANEKTSQNVDNFPSEGINSSTYSTVYNQWISQIPARKIHFSTPRNQVLGRIYPLNTPQPQAQPPRQKHALTEIQKQAVVYFWGWQIRLQEDFTHSELKKAFRKLAQRLHPDRNDGKTKAFIELKAHYQCLLSVF